MAFTMRGRFVLTALIMTALASAASAQISRHTRAAFGPIDERSETPALRAARLAIEDDAIRRFRATGQSPRVLVDGWDRFQRACDRHQYAQGAPEPLPYGTWGEAKESARTLGYDYLILVELWAGQEAPDNPAAGTPVELNYQVFDARDQSVVHAHRFVGNTIDLSGTLASFCRNVGLNIGYNSSPQFDEAVTSMPCATNDAFSSYWMGRGHLDLGMFDEALASFQASLASDPDYRAPALGVADVRLAMARHALNNGEWDSGLTLIDQAISDYATKAAYGGLADSLQVKADLLIASGQKQASWFARKSAAKALLDWGRTSEAYTVALDVWDQMKAEGAPVDPDVAWLLGTCNVLLHGREDANMAQADEYFAQALAVDEKHVPTLLDRGRMYLAWGSAYDPNLDADQKKWRITWIGWAVNDFRSVTLHAPDDPEGWTELGNAFMAWSYRGDDISADERSVSNDQIGQAIAHYQRALNLLKAQKRELDPVMGQLFLKLATCHRRIGRIDPAVDAAWNAQTILGTEDPQPWIELIFVFVDGRDFDRARATYDEAILAVPAAPSELEKLSAYIDQMEEKSLESGTTFRPHQWPNRRQWPPE
jgi:tetratricopeptide (TPR) repeat protein